MLSQASSALAQGELLQREDAWNASVTLERYLHRCDLKTGKLFDAACRLGALSGGDPRAPVDALGASARGSAWRSSSWTMSWTSPAPPSGPASTAAPTCSTARSRRRSSGPANGTTRWPRVDLRAIDTPQRAEEICDAIAATGALARARTQALAVVDEAKAALPDGLPAQQARALELVADSVVARYS